MVGKRVGQKFQIEQNCCCLQLSPTYPLLEMPERRCCFGDCKSEPRFSDRYPEVTRGVFSLHRTNIYIKEWIKAYHTTLCVLEGNATFYILCALKKKAFHSPNIAISPKSLVIIDENRVKNHPKRKTFPLELLN